AESGFPVKTEPPWRGNLSKERVLLSRPLFPKTFVRGCAAIIFDFLVICAACAVFYSFLLH
ncbi:MAG: hypothetical protein Q4E67_06940, partial [Planctomycetia bacterium]|nr:hypothetical protein [Planctomycetia bacterium]